MFQVARAGTEEEKKQKSDELVKAVEKEIEPLLHDAAPFFGGSNKMTLAEVRLTSFLRVMQLLMRSLLCRFKQHPLSSASTLSPTASSFPRLLRSHLTNSRTSRSGLRLLRHRRV